MSCFFFCFWYFLYAIFFLSIYLTWVNIICLRALAVAAQPSLRKHLVSCSRRFIFCIMHLWLFWIFHVQISFSSLFLLAKSIIEETCNLRNLIYFSDKVGHHGGLLILLKQWDMKIELLNLHLELQSNRKRHSNLILSLTKYYIHSTAKHKSQ